MNFLPVEVEDVKSIFSIAKSTVDVITRLYHQYKEPDNDEPGENEDRKDSIKQAIFMLTHETQAQKRFHLEKFVENTLLTPECELEPSTIFCFLQDIEQMTWRQLCLLEGFRRSNSSKMDEKIEIGRSADRHSINGISIKNEIQKLIDLDYLRGSSDHRDFGANYVPDLGQEISKLLDLQSVAPREIGKAFGKGSIKAQVTY